MNDLRDVTFVIPYYKDSEDRLQNLITVVKYLKKHFTTSIFVQEVGDVRTIPDDIFEMIDDYTILSFQFPNIIHRTKMINNMVKKVQTPYFCNYDSDIVLKPEQYLKAHQLLSIGSHVVYPYEIFMRIERKDSQQFFKSLDVSSFKHLQNHGMSVGGCIFFNRAAFIEGGMENEYFISYGPEDYEREYRFKTLGYKVDRLYGTNLYHINHFIGENSDSSHKFFQLNDAEFNKIKNMDRSLLLKYISCWDWK